MTIHKTLTELCKISKGGYLSWYRRKQNFHQENPDRLWFPDQGKKILYMSSAIDLVPVIKHNPSIRMNLVGC